MGHVTVGRNDAATNGTSLKGFTKYCDLHEVERPGGAHCAWKDVFKPCLTKDSIWSEESWGVFWLDSNSET